MIINPIVINVVNENNLRVGQKVILTVSIIVSSIGAFVFGGAYRNGIL
jgi:hypothetical protein